jgi:branched-chain amino acid transport system ATP-binding protein
LSTTLRTISGLLKPSNKDSKVVFKKESIYGIREGSRKYESMPPYKIVEMGLSHVPEGRRVFPEMTVYENLLMGAHTGPMS